MAITNASRLASYVGAAITADGASGIVTAQSFHGDGANLTNVGVDTAQVSTSGLVVSGVSTLAGATLSGVTTFSEDVLIDSSNRAYFSSISSNNLHIYDQSGGGNIVKLTGEIIVGAPLISLRGGALSERMLQATKDGSVDLYYDNSKKLETTGAGVTVTGTTFSNQLNVSGVCTATSFSGSGSGLTGLNIPAGFNELDAALFN